MRKSLLVRSLVVCAAIEELRRRGYSEADIKKILGGNTLRLLEEVEAVSKKLRAQATS